MEFSTPVSIPQPSFQIEPLEQLLFVGSCFADNIGQRFKEERFAVTVNPFGTMYNPASVLHTLERCEKVPRVVFITLGTNHVYRLKETGEIVDNCQKRPQRLFDEEAMTVDACADYLLQAVGLLRQRRADVQVVFTVSPIRYRKYGFHESQLSKATLLLAIDQVVNDVSLLTPHSSLTYFPAYELIVDELRDYRFYAADMLHPSQQAVEFIWEKLVEYYFSPKARQFLHDWKPIKDALHHRPFDESSPAYQDFVQRTQERYEVFLQKYGCADSGQEKLQASLL